jgi:predicted molibdopterin-dependent oxidoreductase YjgC
VTSIAFRALFFGWEIWTSLLGLRARSDPSHRSEQTIRILLPWLMREKEGTLINSEPRIGLIKKVRRAPGQALSDFHICQLIAHYWGCGGMFSQWSSPESVFQILKEVSRGMPNDITGVSDYRMLDECGGIQWPLSEADASRARASDARGRIPSERRLFEDGRFFTVDGKARFFFEEPRDAPERPDAEYPFLLLTGRGTSSQWHTNTRTGNPMCCESCIPRSATWRSIPRMPNAFRSKVTPSSEFPPVGP